MFLLLMQGEIEGEVASNSSTSDIGYDGETGMSFNVKKGTV